MATRREMIKELEEIKGGPVHAVGISNSVLAGMLEKARAAAPEAPPEEPASEEPPAEAAEPPALPSEPPPVAEPPAAKEATEAVAEAAPAVSGEAPPEEPPAGGPPPVQPHNAAEPKELGGPPPPAPPPAPPLRYPYQVAPGKSLVCYRGVLGEGEEIRPSDVSGGADQLNYLAQQGYVLKGPDPKAE